MRKGQSYDEKELLLLVAEGDENAFRYLYHQYKDEVYAFALGITRTIPQAEEIVQDSFVKLWQHRHDLPVIQYFRGWFFTIARNLCYSALRKMALERRTQQAHEQQAEEPVATADDLLIIRENHRLAQAAIDQLPEQQKKVYLLSREEGMTYEQIAAHLNISRNTVKEHLRRAIVAIRAYLDMRMAITLTILSFLGKN